MSAARRQAGFSYVEVLVATVLVAVALIPALEALEIGVTGGAVHETELVRHYHLVARLEEVLARPIAELEAQEQAAAGGPSVYSDVAGSADRRLVHLSTFDADGDSNPDPGIIRVRVHIEATEHALETLAGS